MSDQTELHALRREKHLLIAALVSDEVEALRHRVSELEAENLALRGTLASAEELGAKHGLYAFEQS